MFQLLSHLRTLVVIAMPWQPLARHGKARQGRVRQGTARHCQPRPALASQLITALPALPPELTADADRRLGLRLRMRLLAAAVFQILPRRHVTLNRRTIGTRHNYYTK